MKLARAIGLCALAAVCAPLGCALMIGLDSGKPRETGPDVGAPCAMDAECPVDTACTSWACTGGHCVATPKANGTSVVVGSVAGDCKKNVCQDGEPAVVPDDTDVPSGGDSCVIKKCSGGEVIKESAPDGTACGSKGDLACMDGHCKGCMGDPTTCPLPAECHLVECSSNTCVDTIDVGKILSNPAPDDCIVEICDENGNATVVGDMSETPPQTGDDCKVEKCGADGDVYQESANEGQKCADAANACYEESVCESGVCASKPKLAGLYAGDDGVPGNCQALVCDGKGQMVAGAYDADTGADPDPTDCSEPACMNGSPTSADVMNGLSCTAGGGVKCCGGVCCPTNHTCAETGDCCPGPQQCPNGTCCPTGKTCSVLNLCM